MGNHQQSSSNYHQKTSKYSSQYDGDEFNARQALANWILNLQMPRDLYSILVIALLVYITWRIFRVSLRVAVSLIRPLIFLLIILILLPYVYELKTSSLYTNNILKDGLSWLQWFSGYVIERLGAIYRHTTSFYEKH